MANQKWKIPYKSGTREYQLARKACVHFDKPYDKLTEEEKTWSPEPKRPTIPAGNYDDLYFLADAMMASCKAMGALTLEIRGLLEEIRKERTEQKPE